MTTLKVSSPAELISAVPFLVGFHPADSLTVVAMHGPRVVFAVRTDLPEHGTPDEQAKAAVLHLARVVLKQQVHAVTIIGYGEESRATPAVLRISDVFRKAGLTIVDELRVTDDRYWSYLCTDLSCCPEEGRPCEPLDSVVAAEATFAGAVALPNREALEAQLAAVTGDDREAMTAATARAMLRLAALAALASERPPQPQPDQTASDSQRAHSRPAAESSPSVDQHDRRPEESEDAAGSEHPHRSGDRPDLRPDAAPGDAAPPDAGRPGPALAADAAHDLKAAEAAWAGMGLSRPRSAELHLERVIWASLGVAPPVAEEPGPATEGAGLLTEGDHFLALIRNAGRMAVREAERCYSTGGRLTDDDAAWLGVLLLHMPVRDYAWTRTRTQEWELALWSDLTRRVEPSYLPAPAALLAFVAWRTGLGPLASVAVERALDQKPDYSLAVLLHRAIAIGLPPSALDGWPVVQGMPRVDDRSDPAVDCGPDDAVSPEGTQGCAPGPSGENSGDQGRPQPEGGSGSPLVEQEKARSAAHEGSRPVGQEKARAGQQGGRLPVRIRSDTPLAGPRDRAGGGPDRREERRRTTRRAAQRRI